MQIPDQYRETFKFYVARGLAGRMGFGERPAILVVDMINAFTDPRSPLSGQLDSQLKEIKRLLDAGRERSVTIIFSTVAYDPGFQEAGLWIRKIRSLDVLVQDSEGVKVDPRLEQRSNETLLVKKYASCFFGTDLASRLVSKRVDTLIITGCTTSGCVRATAVDSCSLGFHTIVPQEAVGDRAELPHWANLFDIEGKYGDVVGVDDVLDYLSKR
ncbi:MAG: carbamoylsarcosine amidase [Acidobacteria bacterium 13_1_40CM_2_68_5]|nr:MAG: carbamoylsarcosine amidase [Acidobacteria bacterium 13_1_40CM_2_68_5]